MCQRNNRLMASSTQGTIEINRIVLLPEKEVATLLCASVQWQVAEKQATVEFLVVR